MGGGQTFEYINSNITNTSKILGLAEDSEK
jgi:hypothetical protein